MYVSINSSLVFLNEHVRKVLSSAGTLKYTVQSAYKVVRIQGMCAYSVRSSGPDSCVCICDEIFIHTEILPLGFLVPNLCPDLQLALTARRNHSGQVI